MVKVSRFSAESTFNEFMSAPGELSYSTGYIPRWTVMLSTGGHTLSQAKL